MKKILWLIINNFAGKVRYQDYFRKMHNISLHCMWLGGGGGVENSGEEVILKNMKISEGGGVIFDVGANIGNYANMLLNKLDSGKELNIHCFEPSKTTFKKLKENVTSSRVCLNNFGLGNKIEELSLYTNEPLSGLASLYKRELTHFNIEMDFVEKVNISTIDTYCMEKNIEHIDLLKLDIEGNELNALHGAKDMINNSAVKNIQFEFGGCNIDSRTYFRDFWYMLSNKYEFYRMVKDGVVRITQYDERLEQFSCTNYFLTLKDKE